MSASRRVRALALPTAVLTALVVGLLAAPAGADDAVPPAAETTADAEAALQAAEALAAGAEAPASSPLTALPGLGRLLARRLPDRTTDGSQVQRDLYRLADRLEGPDRRRAEALLARPTDGRRDQVGDGYRAPSKRICGPHVCVHFVSRTRDAPPDRAWVKRTLSVMERVWRTEVGRLGYRRPLPDGGRGGDARFDVYLKDLGAIGAYGYCTPEQPGRARAGGTSAGYCVLDDDFSPAQFGGASALRSLKVTAAHEFFHAVQLAYTVGADPWFAETTAVWMENQVFGGIDDNRQYLPYGQLAAPGRPLDRFQPTGFAQYGNFVFWERVADRFGQRVVRRTWERAARGAFSARAVEQELAGRRGGLPGVLAEYGSALSDAARAFPEGRSWPTGRAPDPLVVDAAAPRAVVRSRLDHLATRSWLLRPAAGTTGRLRVQVRGPRNAATAPGAHVRLVKADGRIVSRRVDLDRRGRGSTTVPFRTGGTASVTVTVANASTRFACRRGTLLSCRGKPRDDGARFRVVASLVP